MVNIRKTIAMKAKYIRISFWRHSLVVEWRNKLMIMTMIKPMMMIRVRADIFLCSYVTYTDIHTENLEN